MKLYTKTGDKGETALFGGERVGKDHLRIKAYGTVDELNALVGVALSEIVDSELKETILKIQNDLFTLGSDLASPFEKENKNFIIPRISQEHITNLESKIDMFDSQVPKLKNFILPGGTKGASLLHLARTVCRRAERKVVELSRETGIGDNVIIYLNRLSDLLFVLARFENFKSSLPDIEWQK